MPSLVPIVRCREIPTNWKVENRSIARLELVYRSTLTYVAARIHSFNERSRPEERHYERFSVRSTFATNRYTGLYMYVLRVLCISYAPKHSKCPSRNSFVRLDDRKKFLLRIPVSPFPPFPSVFFSPLLEKLFRRWR